MAVSAFQSQCTQTSGSMPLTSDESDNSVSGPREAALAVIMCLCLMAMAGMVVTLIITTSDILGGGTTVARTDADIESDPLGNPRPSAAKHPTPATTDQISSTPPIVQMPWTVKITLATTTTTTTTTSTTTTTTTTTTVVPVKEIICTVSETASSESMYPPDKYCDYLFYSDVVASAGQIVGTVDPFSWQVFRQRVRKYKIMKLGISFAYGALKLDNLDDAAGDLSALRRQGIRHYGLLTVLAFPDTFIATVSRTKPILEKLKQLQGRDQTAKTVIAIGCVDYSGNFLSNFTVTLTEVANTYKVDIVIAITSVGWLAYPGFCNALPPTMLTSTTTLYEGLLNHWHIVSHRANFTRPWIQTGLSFDLSTLQYDLVERAPSLNESLFSPCQSVKRKSQEVLCANGDFRSKADNYFGDEASAYGVLSNASKVVAMSEYNDSVAFKFNTAVGKKGIRERTAWLFYNVDLLDFNHKCPEPTYTVLRLFCVALKSPSDQRCQ
ncbi:uncharacterized protein [Dermacentor albipictus]|uniref:uncharacterized protein isoform X2 n=1 Tax=Dermacentor albipictus TaxID=60249 RepID=UPI0031FD931D